MNGVAERTGGLIIEMARSMLIGGHADPSLCGEAFIYAVVCLNVCPIRFKDDGSFCSRMEKWTGRKQPNAHKRLKKFACAAWPLEPTWAAHDGNPDKLFEDELA